MSFKWLALEVPAPSRPVAEASAAQAENKACDFLGPRRKYGLRDGGGGIETMSVTGQRVKGSQASMVRFVRLLHCSPNENA